MARGAPGPVPSGGGQPAILGWGLLRGHVACCSAGLSPSSASRLRALTMAPWPIQITRDNVPVLRPLTESYLQRLCCTRRCLGSGRQGLTSLGTTVYSVARCCGASCWQHAYDGVRCTVSYGLWKTMSRVFPSLRVQGSQQGATPTAPVRAASPIPEPGTPLGAGRRDAVDFLFAVFSEHPLGPGVTSVCLSAAVWSPCPRIRAGPRAGTMGTWNEGAVSREDRAL